MHQIKVGEYLVSIPSSQEEVREKMYKAISFLIMKLTGHQAESRQTMKTNKLRIKHNE